MACVAYWILLTILLLVPNPAGLVGLHHVPIFPWGKFGVHLIAFTILCILMHAMRWPKPVWWPLVVVLMLYGITTESLQNLFPPRTPRVMDGIENCLGILAGSAIYWLLLQFARPGVGRLELASKLVDCAAQDQTPE
jgi:hypothetical protein